MKERWTIRKRFRIEMAHRLTSAFTTECTRVHGHSYVVDLFFSSGVLNRDGMVVDFGEVKAKAGRFVTRYDHTFLQQAWFPSPQDPNGIHMSVEADGSSAGNLVSSWNPTAENMAKQIFEDIRTHTTLPISKVRVHETSTGWAEYTQEEG